MEDLHSGAQVAPPLFVSCLFKLQAWKGSFRKATHGFPWSDRLLVSMVTSAIPIEFTVPRHRDPGDGARSWADLIIEEKKGDQSPAYNYLPTACVGT